MSAYWSTFKARFRVLLQYRAAALAGLATQLFWGLIRVMIFDAFYRSTTLPQPLSREQTITYLWLIQALLLLIPFRQDPEAQALVRSGAVSYELTRPIDLYWFWYSRSVALRTAPALLRAAPQFIIAGLFLGMQPPASIGAGVASVISVLAAVLLSSAITTLMSISLMWTVSGDGLARLMGTIAWVLSGAVVPLPIFPEWAQRVLQLLPFAGLMDVPLRLYVGDYAAADLPRLLLNQVGWTLGLILLGRCLMGQALRRLTVQGG